MIFHCLCISPALDATIALTDAVRGVGEVHKDVVRTITPGGKGLNVARYLARRGAQVTCGGFLGRENAAPFEQELAHYGITDCFMRVPGSTRLNEMITWPGGSAKLNAAAFPGIALPLEEMCAQFCAGLNAGDVAILSGSLPPGVAVEFYAQILKCVVARGAHAVLDTSGPAFVAGCAAHPALIKPNADECAPLVGFVPTTPMEFRAATQILHRYAAHVIISDGARGAWFEGECVPAPAVTVCDTTAAGDTLLAEYCYQLYACGLAPDEAARWAVAAGSAACTMPGGMPPPLDQIEALHG